MSTFSGKIEEMPEISVDRFDGENVDSKVYFLSHCHSDHMKGLDNWAFQKSLLDRPDTFLYGSSISIRILKGRFPTIESKLKVLPIGISHLVKVQQNEHILVTLLAAGHCPGSVMFLFERDKKILYTGDYRIGTSDLRKMRAFYSLGKLKNFDRIYLDTTFYKKSFLSFPRRQESMESICEIIKEWIDLSKSHIIKISLSARYGSEFLFLEIAKAFNMPIHVSSEVYNTYKYIPEMDKSITVKRNDTQIHAGCGSHLKDICFKEDNTLVRTIIPSALWWEDYDFKKGITFINEKGEYRVCYSCHASYEEITDALLFLRPRAIEPCVLPSNCKEKEAMMNSLENMIKMYRDDLKGVGNDQVKFFNTEIILNRTCSEEDIDDDLKDILGSPKRVKKSRCSFQQAESTSRH